MADDDEGRVLDPEELDVADDERVERLEENRFVVAADEGGPSVDADDDPSEDAPDPEPARPEPPTVDAAAVADWLADSLSNNGFQYGFDATVKFDGDIDRHRMVSNDVVATFETLLLWYGRQASDDTEVGEALGLLVAESEVPLRVPPSALRAACERHDLSPEDSVAELLAAAAEDDGLVVGSR